MNLAPLLVYFDLAERHFALRGDGDRLLIRPAADLTDDDRVNIAANKAGLLDLCRQADLLRAEEAVWAAWWAKKERFGDTPANDLRPEARAASEGCLALHAQYMALVEASA